MRSLAVQRAAFVLEPEVVDRRPACWTCDHVRVRQASVAVVTGASRGIGRRLSLHLAQGGTRVVAVARPSPELDSLAGDVAGTELTTMPADVTDPDAVNAVFEAVTAQFGPPVIVITCAGSIDALGPVADTDPDRWWDAVTVDLRGTMLTAQAALKAMLPAGRGRILTMYGNLGERGTPNLSAFAAAKAGVARFTETLAAEVRGTGVIVLCMHPGFVRTPMTEHLAWITKASDGCRSSAGEPRRTGETGVRPLNSWTRSLSAPPTSSPDASCTPATISRTSHDKRAGTMTSAGYEFSFRLIRAQPTDTIRSDDSRRGVDTSMPLGARPVELVGGVRSSRSVRDDTIIQRRIVGVRVVPTPRCPGEIDAAPLRRPWARSDACLRASGAVVCARRRGVARFRRRRLPRVRRRGRRRTIQRRVGLYPARLSWPSGGSGPKSSMTDSPVTSRRSNSELSTALACGVRTWLRVWASYTVIDQHSLPLA
jgi:NAD(P)-dependent dehydrogenase (short-subunit alcohol dehydrogenase family)